MSATKLYFYTDCEKKIAPAIANCSCPAMVPSSPDFPDILRRIRDEMYLIKKDLARELGVRFLPVSGWGIRKIAASLLARAQFEGFCNRVVKQAKLGPEAVEP